MQRAKASWAITGFCNAVESKYLSTAKAKHTPLAKLNSCQTTLDAYVEVEKYLLIKQRVSINTGQRFPV